MLNKTELLDYIKTQESQYIEFKTSFGKEVIESVVAFANSYGGYVFVGIKDECRLHGVIESKFEEFVHGFRVTLYKEKLNEPVKLILKLVKENPNITKQQMIEKTNLSRATITRYIKKLKEQKLLRRIGSDKTGYWEILE